MEVEEAMYDVSLYEVTGKRATIHTTTDDAVFTV